MECVGQRNKSRIITIITNHEKVLEVLTWDIL